MKYAITDTRANERTTTKIQLADDCRNGHEHFSLTANIYEKTPRGWRDVGGGCCHEHILALRPNLAPFAALHLSDQDGVPMHAFSNAWYWFQGAFPAAASSPYHGGSGPNGKAPADCLRIFSEHTRATPEQVQTIEALQPRSEQELQAALEDLGFPEQWKREAQAAIQQLEAWTGETFASKATRPSWAPLTPETRQTIAERRANGYYDPAAVAKRDADARQARRGKRVADLRAAYASKTAELEQDHRLEVWLAQTFDNKPNVIWYRHSNTLQANWTSTERLFTAAEWGEFTRQIPGDLFNVPPVFKFQERPKY